jgi:hypothetical protein
MRIVVAGASSSASRIMSSVFVEIFIAFALQNLLKAVNTFSSTVMVIFRLPKRRPYNR